MTTSSRPSATSRPSSSSMKDVRTSNGLDGEAADARSAGHQPWQLNGAGSSSKVMHTLGAAPASLSGTPEALPQRPSLGRTGSSDAAQGLFATLKKASLNMHHTNARSSLPERAIKTVARLPSTAATGPSSRLARTSMSSTSDGEDDDEEDEVETPVTPLFAVPHSPATRVDDTPPTPIVVAPFPEPVSPKSIVPRRPSNPREMSANSLRTIDADLPSYMRTERQGSASSGARGSPIPSALDGSMLNSPDFVNSEHGLTSAPPKAEGQIEDIVPWLFQPADGVKDSSPRARQTSFSPTSGPKQPALRSARSSNGLRPTSPGDPTASPEKKSKSRRLLGMLRRKTSTGESLKSAEPGEVPFSNPFSDSPPVPRHQPVHPSSDPRKSRKGSKGKTTRDGPLPRGPVNAGGISLDTNLDHMEGIIAPDSLTPIDLIEGVIPPDPFRRRGSTLAQTAGLGLASSVELDPANRPSRPTSRGSDSPGERRGSTFSLGMASVIAPSISSNGTKTPVPGSAATPTATTGAVWTAPDSWGVHGDEEPGKQSSTDDSDDETGTRLSFSEKGTHAPPTPLIGETGTVRPGSSGGRFASVTPGRRPGTATSANGIPSKTVLMSIVRVYKPDGTHTVVSCPINATAHDLQQLVLRKTGQTPTKGVYRLFARERGLERTLAPSERPLLLQRRRLEQAGYVEADKLEELGREDHSYLIKFTFKPEPSSGYNTRDDEQIDGFEYVSLEARGVRTIPIFLHRHAHELVSLNLSRNPKLELPGDFIQACTALRELRMMDMGIKRLPHSVRLTSGLTRLDVSNNRIVDLDHAGLEDLLELSSLKLSNNRLSTLPDYFGRFHALKYLIISNNKFDALPLIVCEITTLIDLDVSFNNLTALPDEICKLVNLERLVLFGNAILTLPATLSKLEKLSELDVRRNGIASFAFLSELKALDTVRLQHNAAWAIEADMANVRHLYVSHNPLTKLQLTGLSASLTSLTLTHAKLSTLPVELFSDLLTSLELLVMDNNALRSLPETLAGCPSLLRISCRANHIDSLPAWFGKLQKLQELDLSNNDISSVSPDIWLCGELVSLNLSSNLLSEFPDPPPALTMEDSHADDERKHSVSSTRSGGKVAAAMASSLQRLMLADNRLTDEIFHPISLLTDLRLLNLSFNDLYEVPSRILSRNMQLEELYLSGNMLSTLPEEDIARLVNLRILHLNGNKLQTLPAELGQLKRLHVLDVGCNMLKYNIANWKFDWNWNWNTELRYLNLSGNKRLEIKPAGQQAMNVLEDSPGANRKRRNLSDFTAMKKLRVLGLMDVTLTIPIVPDDTEDRRVRTSLPDVNGMGYGIADALGRIEELTMVDMVIRRFRQREDECIIGFFDGRPRARGLVASSGSRIAKYLQDCFASALSTELSRTARAKAQLASTGADPEDLPSAAEDAAESLRRTFLNLNRDYGNILLPYFDARRKDSGTDAAPVSFSLAAGNASDARSGATAVIVFMQGRTMHVANVGDALAVMATRGGGARLMSVKHDPQAPEEVTRIRASEGFVSSKGLLNDAVDVSRSFGHYHVFPAMNASPHVTTLEVTEDDEFLIIGSRGLWEYMTYQAAVDCARKERSDPMSAAQKLRDLAIAYGADSSIMVMVVALSDLFKAKQGPALNGRGSTDLAESEVYAGQKVGRRGGQQNVGPGERYLTLLDREIPPPVGNVALVFTDIRNSTVLWETNPGMMQSAMRMHNQLLRRQLRAIGGYEVKTEGDAFIVSFSSVTAALLWCFTVQVELLREDWPQALLDSEEGREIVSPSGDLLYRGLSVRMGIHWGQPVCEADPITRRMDYFGPVVNRASRISGVADGGQISCSTDALEVIKLVCGLDEQSTELDEDDARAFETRLAESDELDESTKRDVLVIRKLGVGIFELGERRLKGLETPENLFLLYPSQLAGRLKPIALESPRLMASPETMLVTPSVATRGPEMFEPIPQLLETSQMTQVGRLTLRIEKSCSAISRPSDSVEAGLARRGSRAMHPFHMHSPVPLEATDEELVLFLENFVTRIENVLASLQLHSLGPYNDVLAAIASATQVDQRQLIQALSMFASVMGQSGQQSTI